MPSLNKIYLIGHAGRDLNVLYSSKGTAIADITLATDKNYQSNGQWQKETTWHTIKCFGKAAENAQNKNIQKGNLIFVEGEIKNESWQDKTTGETKHKTVIIAYKIDNLSPPIKKQNSQDDIDISNPQNLTNDNINNGFPF